MLEHRLNQSESQESKTEAQKLYDLHQEGGRLKREGERIQKEVRPEIDALIANGEFVGYPDAYLTLQESAKYTVDIDALVADLGEKIALRVCDVSSTKVKQLIELGLIKPDAPYVTKTVATSLVTKTQPR